MPSDASLAASPAELRVSRILDSRGWDVGARLVGCAVYGFFSAIHMRGVLMGAAHPQGTAGFAFDIVTHALICAFWMQCIWLTLVRERARGRAPGVQPVLSALLGSYLPFALVLLPRAAPNLAWDVASSVLLMAGNVLTVFVLARLGRSFSVLPEARQLVRTGLYGVVRHPLYLVEQISVLGLLMQQRSLAALVLCVVQTGFQVARMRNEERALSAAFPEYREYAAGTARLIPGVW